MRINLRRLKYNIWLYFIIFALGILCVVWFLQLVLTNRYFYNARETLMIKTGENIAARYLTWNENPGNEQAEGDFDSAVDSARRENLIVVYGTAEELRGGEFYSVISNALVSYAGEGNPQNGFSDILPDDRNEEIQIFVNRMTGEGDDAVYIVLLSTLDSIKDTTDIMQRLLVIISLVVIVIALGISFIIASSIADPLVNMTKTAKRLAAGDFSVEFNANGYSEIQELADTLNYMKEELREKSALQRELLANVTHDLKTPLTMIRAYAEMIQDFSGEIKEKRDKHAQVIIDEADRLTMLVNDILNLSKVQSGMNGLNLDRIDLSGLLSNVIDRFQSFLESNGYTIKTEITPELYSVCDDKKIEQVFYNLIGNAINYTGEDKTVSVYLTENDGKIIFEVIDSGKGIEEDKIDTIWEKYYRASDTHKRPVKGTGLGLSIVKAILEAHGLKYGVISRKDEGSNFFVEFVKAGEEKNG